MSDRQVDTKVVVTQSTLRGLGGDDLQRVAIVYVNGEEYRVSAPPSAVGDALEWASHFSVSQPSKEEFNTEIEVSSAERAFAIRAVQQQLERTKRHTVGPPGTTPDGRYRTAQICVQGHVQLSDGSFQEGQYCNKCGSACIHACQHCKTSIRGQSSLAYGYYRRPSYCHACGRPYPWMQERLSTARELLRNDDKLTLDERNELWDLLQYVMSDPKADLVPAKKKLINIKLGKATEYTRDLVLDLVAKYAAEMSKG